MCCCQGMNATLFFWFFLLLVFFSWSAISVASAWQVLSLFFFFFLCFFFALALASSDCGTSSLSSAVGWGGGLGDGDLRLLFFFFFGTGLVCVMKMSASSSLSSSTFSTRRRFFAAEGPFSGSSHWLMMFNLGFFHIGNDPSAGSPTETLLRLLLPLNDQVWPTSRHPPLCCQSSGASQKASLNHSIGSSDGRCVQRAGT